MQSDSPDLEDLTDAEREALVAPKAVDTSDADAKAAADKAAADAAAAEKAKAEQAAAVKKDTPAPKDTVTADAPTFVPKILDKANERDFDKELDALEAKYADPESGMTLEEYKKAERALLREQTTAQVLAEVEARTQASAAAFAAQNFNATIKSFFDDPAHQDFKKDDKGNPPPEFRAAFQKACDYVDDGKMSNADVVARAYKTLKITSQDLFEEPAPVAAQTDAEKAAAEKKAAEIKAAAEKAEKDKQDAINKRKPPLKDVPVTIGNMPNAGEDQDQDSVVDKMAALDIGELEDQLAHMKPEDVEALLRKTPGSETRGKAAK